MIWAASGIRGVLTNGVTRDTDEGLLQKAMPVWSRWVVQPMFQGRVEWGGDSMPVVIGGQRIDPGDLIVADGDGAIVVPIEVIDDVLKYAIQESENDKRARAMRTPSWEYPPTTVRARNSTWRPIPTLSARTGSALCSTKAARPRAQEPDCVVARQLACSAQAG
jgi:Aldolase/RraA